MTSFESWGTETANYANFVRFSSVFNHFAPEIHKTQSRDIFCILMHFLVFLNILQFRFDQKWWVFIHSSIPHTKILLVPNNLLWKLNGFEVSLPKAITSGVAKCFSSSKNYGTLITIWFLANHKLSTVLICLYQKPFASVLANSLIKLSSWWVDYQLWFSTAFTTSHNLVG